MLAAAIVQACATAVLVGITWFYVRETRQMRKSQQRVESYNAQALISIQVTQIIASRLSTVAEDLCEMRLKLTNLKSAPALRAQLQTLLYLGDDKKKTLFPGEIIPCIPSNAEHMLAVLFQVKFATVLGKATKTISETVSEKDEKGELVLHEISGRHFPRCEIAVSFDDEYGNRGTCSTEVVFMPARWQDGSWGLFARPTNINDSLRCEWTPRKDAK